MDVGHHEKNRRILIIDDNEVIHDDFRVILTSQALDTSTLDQAEAAILGEAFDQVDQEIFEVDSAFQAANAPVGGSEPGIDDGFGGGRKSRQGQE